MDVHVLSLFPSVFVGPLEASILKRAQEREALRVQLHDIRDFTTDRHRNADDYPFGGGPGMVMKPEPVFGAVEHAVGGSRGAAGPRGPSDNAGSPAVAAGPAFHPEDRCGAGRSPRSHPHLRPLRGRRRSRRGTSVHPGVERRRLRAHGRGASCSHHHRRRRPTAARRAGRCGIRRKRLVLRGPAGGAAVHPGPPASEGWRSRPCFSPATTARSPGGGIAKPCCGPGSAGRTCCRRWSSRPKTGRFSTSWDRLPAPTFTVRSSTACARPRDSSRRTPKPGGA